LCTQQKEAEALPREMYEVLWPLGRSTGRATAMSSAVGPEGPRRVGFVWDYVFRGDEMFDVVREELAKRFPGSEFVPYETFGNMHGHDEREQLAALPERLRAERVDAVVVGVGA
jgi:hypothetical protein